MTSDTHIHSSISSLFLLLLLLVKESHTHERRQRAVENAGLPPALATAPPAPARPCMVRERGLLWFRVEGLGPPGDRRDLAA